jgi:hypothetical protein
MDSHFMLSLVHLLFVVPLFLGIGYLRSSIPHWLFLVVLVLGIVILIYHSYKLFLRLKIKSNYIWVNAFHVLLVAPLLIYIGYNKKDTPRFAYELLLMMAFAAGGYHLFSLVRELQIAQ